MCGVEPLAVSVSGHLRDRHVGFRRPIFAAPPASPDNIGDVVKIGSLGVQCPSFLPAAPSMCGVEPPVLPFPATKAPLCPSSSGPQPPSLSAQPRGVDAPFPVDGETPLGPLQLQPIGRVASAALDGPITAQHYVVFDVVLHVRIRRFPAPATVEAAISDAVRSSPHLAPPVAFRLLHNKLPDLPDVQVVVWSEPNPGHRVLPFKVGSGGQDICTINLPCEASPFEASTRIILSCPGHDRLQFQVAQGHNVILADGYGTSPFVPHQFAGADSAIITSPATPIPAAFPSYLPAELIRPVQLAQARFTSASEDVVVHRHERLPVLVFAREDLPPQQLLTRLLTALNLHGSGRMSVVAVMPCVDPCRLNVVVHPGPQRISDLIPCLVDLRRVSIPPGTQWAVIHLPPSCNLADIEAAVASQCASTLPHSAIYLNYQRVGTSGIGLHRHSVVTLLGCYPDEHLDVATREGTFYPRCIRGSDVAALRAGLAAFLAAPSALSTTTTSTTWLDCSRPSLLWGCNTEYSASSPSASALPTVDRGPALAARPAPNLAAPASALPSIARVSNCGDAQPSELFTVFDKFEGPRVLPKPLGWNDAYCSATAIALSRVPGPTVRRLVSVVPGWPVPQFIVSSARLASLFRAVVLFPAEDPGRLKVAEAPFGRNVALLQGELISGLGQPFAPQVLDCQVDSRPFSCLAPLPHTADYVVFTTRSEGFLDKSPVVPLAPTGPVAPARWCDSDGGVLTDSCPIIRLCPAQSRLCSRRVASAATLPTLLGVRSRCGAAVVATCGTFSVAKDLSGLSHPSLARPVTEPAFDGPGLASDDATPIVGPPGPQLRGPVATPVPSESLPAHACAHDALDLAADTSIPFVSLDEVTGVRNLAGRKHWALPDFYREAVYTASLPGAPSPRHLRVEVAGLPSPQVVLTQDRGHDGCPTRRGF